jgi:hypothetical protein
LERGAGSFASLWVTPAGEEKRPALHVVRKNSPEERAGQVEKCSSTVS